MLVDLLIAAVLAFFGARGLRSGTVRQLAGWAGLLLGRVAAKPLALVLTLAMAARMDFPPVGARVALSALCFYTLYIVGSLAAAHLLRKLAGRREHGRLDRAGGFVLGVGSGAIVLLVLLSALLFLEKPLRAVAGGPTALMRRSAALRYVRRHNVFGPAPAELERLQALLGDPGVRASLQDDALARAIETADWAKLQDDPRVAALLKHPRIVGPLTDSLDYDYDGDERR